MRIGHYLLDTRKCSIIYKPDKSKGLECYLDVGFAGGWSQADAENADNVLSRTGYILMYANCPIYGLVASKWKLLLALPRLNTSHYPNRFETSLD
jgi:hypothetical protein